MPPILDQFGLAELSPASRFALAQALWDSVNEDLSGLPISPEVRAELERRLAFADGDPSRGVPSAEVRGAARARWQK